MKKEFIIKVLIICLFVSLVFFFILWLVLKPEYDSSITSRYLDNVNKLHKYVTRNADKIISHWITITPLIANQISLHPKEGEIVLSSILSLHPEILQTRVYSSITSDELECHNTLYSQLNLSIADSLWSISKIDTSVSVAWIKLPEQDELLFIVKTRFHIQNQPFNISVVWKANQIKDIFKEMLSVDQCISFMLNQNKLLVAPDTSSIDISSIINLSNDTVLILQNQKPYNVIVSNLASNDMKMITAVSGSDERIKFSKQIEIIILLGIGSILLTTVLIIVLFLVVENKSKKSAVEKAELKSSNEIESEEQ